MAASATVSQLSQSGNSLTPRYGVVTLFGYGITVSVDRGHLVIKDGIGATRSEARFARIGHGLRRLVIVGSDGFISLAALRWLADQGASFVMLERDGSVLATTGPVRPSDARLRRAQALASANGAALEISKYLIRHKLAAQEQLAREKLNDVRAADLIAMNRAAIDEAQTVETLRLSESRAAYAYWSAWRSVPIVFPKRDLSRVPKHWQCFGARISPLTGSPRLSVNPPNTMLNYLYALLESEARLAAAALGLDPGIGLMHVDSQARDSLACDLMEPVRPQVDSYVFDCLTHQPLRREWFFEQRDGNCRLMGSFTAKLSETAPTWERAVAPIAESVVRTLWSTISKPVRLRLPATRLTQGRRRQAKGTSPDLPTQAPPKPPRVCRGCGASIPPGKSFCFACGVIDSTERLAQVARTGREAAQSVEAQASRAVTQRRNALAQNAWKESDLPSWLNEKVYFEQIQPRLKGITGGALSSALCVSRSYAGDIRTGRRRPHPRHWLRLARLVGVFFEALT
jgi:CRISPR-associated endonuclease Cas1